MSVVGNAFNIPHFLKAATPEGLRLRMLENNLVMKAECRYFDISFDGQVWVVWFYKIAQEQPSAIKKAGGE